MFDRLAALAHLLRMLVEPCRLIRSSRKSHENLIAGIKAGDAFYTGWVIHVTSSMRPTLPVCLRIRTYRYVAACLVPAPSVG